MDDGNQTMGGATAMWTHEPPAVWLVGDVGGGIMLITVSGADVYVLLAVTGAGRWRDDGEVWRDESGTAWPSPVLAVDGAATELAVRLADILPESHAFDVRAIVVAPDCGLDAPASAHAFWRRHRVDVCRHGDVDGPLPAMDDVVAPGRPDLAIAQALDAELRRVDIAVPSGRSI